MSTPDNNPADTPSKTPSKTPSNTPGNAPDAARTAVGTATGDTPWATGEEIIRFQDVTKRYGRQVVLDDLCFSVYAGKHVTLIGPSGSGKTTILRLLMTLIKADEGSIRVEGDYLTHEERNGKLVPAGERHIREVRKKIGMVFQQFNLFPNMTVMRNLTEAPVRVLGLSRDEAEQRARELLEMVDLTEMSAKYPSQLSGGQQQRVAIARALAMRPRILLLDEVTSALDPELVAGVLDLLRDIAHHTDITMLTVTHEMNFARDISDCVMMFDHGKILEAATPEKLFNDPEHTRTREFLNAVL